MRVNIRGYVQPEMNMVLFIQKKFQGTTEQFFPQINVQTFQNLITVFVVGKLVFYTLQPNELDHCFDRYARGHWDTTYHFRGQYKSTNSPESFSIFDLLQLKFH